MPDRLQQAITVLQTRFGSAAPRPAAPPCPARPTGISELDALTGIGGWAGGGVRFFARPPGPGERTPAPRRHAPPRPGGAGAPRDKPRRPPPPFLGPLRAPARPLPGGGA